MLYLLAIAFCLPVDIGTVAFGAFVGAAFLRRFL